MNWQYKILNETAFGKKKEDKDLVGFFEKIIECETFDDYKELIIPFQATQPKEWKQMFNLFASYLTFLMINKTLVPDALQKLYDVVSVNINHPDKTKRLFIDFFTFMSKHNDYSKTFQYMVEQYETDAEWLLISRKTGLS